MILLFTNEIVYDGKPTDKVNARSNNTIGLTYTI